MLVQKSVTTITNLAGRLSALDASENLHVLARGREQKDGSRLAGNFGKVDYRAGGIEADRSLSLVHLSAPLCAFVVQRHLIRETTKDTKAHEGNRGLSGFSFLL